MFALAYPLPARRRWIELFAIVVAAAALLARPALVVRAQPIVALLGVYAFVLAASLIVRVTPSTGSLAPWLVAVIGCSAAAGVRFLSGPGAVAATGGVAIALNTVASVAEEAVFRRALYGLLQGWGAPIAVAGSALAFALMHVPAYGLGVLPVDLGAGLLLSWQRWASGRWEVPAATHALMDMLALVR